MTNSGSGQLEAFGVRRRPRHSLSATAAAGRGTQYTGEEILKAIRRWSLAYGEPPTHLDWEPARARRLGQAWRAERFEDGQWPTVRMVRRQFSTMNDAVRQTGMRPRRAPARIRPNLSSADAITEAMIEWTRRYGDVPCMADWGPGACPPSRPGVADSSVQRRRLAECAQRCASLRLVRRGGRGSRPPPAAALEQPRAAGGDASA